MRPGLEMLTHIKTDRVRAFERKSIWDLNQARPKVGDQFSKGIKSINYQKKGLFKFSETQ